MNPHLTLAPKARFIASPRQDGPDQRTPADQWSDVTGDPLYHRAIETALAEMVLKLGAPTVADAANMGLKLEGAKMFISILTNLGVPERKRAPYEQENQLIPT